MSKGDRLRPVNQAAFNAGWPACDKVDGCTKGMGHRPPCTEPQATEEKTDGQA